ncbi:MAG: hypothetical protein Q7O66_04605 [Dehalococcoidia bacterium]|nr:hypothetical protein [Dehalococcoidia bacterium]
MLHRLWKMRVVHWGLGGGLIASICCVGPPLAILLGLSSASFLVAATSYSPLFYVLGGLLLVGGLLYARRRQATVCSVEETKRNKWLFPLVLSGTAGALYILLTQVVSPILAPVAGQHIASVAAAAGRSAAASGQASPAQPRMFGVRRADLSISGMT